MTTQLKRYVQPWQIVNNNQKKKKKRNVRFLIIWMHIYSHLVESHWLRVWENER